jgi:hypothetical protein
VGTAGQREGESGRGQEQRHRQGWPMGQRERERGGAQGCADRRDPPVRKRGRAGARTGLSGLPWAEFGFPFSREFLISFLFIFSRFSIQIQIKFQIQTKSNMCNNSKNI